MLPEKSRIEEIIRIHNELQKLYYSGLARAIKKFMIRLYQVIADFILFNSGSKSKWG